MPSYCFGRAIISSPDPDYDLDWTPRSRYRLPSFNFRSAFDHFHRHQQSLDNPRYPAQLIHRGTRHEPKLSCNGPEMRLAVVPILPVPLLRSLHPNL